MARKLRDIAVSLGMPPKMSDNMVGPWLHGKLRELGMRAPAFDAEDIEEFLRERCPQKSC